MSVAPWICPGFCKAEAILPRSPCHPAPVRATSVPDECASRSDIELDDEDQDDHHGAEHTSIEAACERADAKMRSDLESARSETSIAGDNDASPSPRGRGKRRRQGIDYTCLDIMLFGLPGDVPEEDMVHALSLGGRPKAATEGTSRNLHGQAKHSAGEKSNAGGGTHVGRHQSVREESGQARGTATFHSRSSSSSASAVTASSLSESSSLAILLSGATSDGEEKTGRLGSGAQMQSAGKFAGSRLGPHR